MARRFAFMIALTMIATECPASSSPVPKDYAGPTALLKDSTDVPAGADCGSFFFLYKYNGKEVHHVLDESAAANAGHGLVMGKTPDWARLIPIQDAAFHIVARTHCAAPIQELTRKMYVVDGVVHFTPEAGQTYVVTGELAADHGAVWVRNERTGAQVGNKLLVQGEPKASKWNGATTGKVIEVPSGS